MSFTCGVWLAALYFCPLWNSIGLYLKLLRYDWFGAEESRACSGSARRVSSFDISCGGRFSTEKRILEAEF